MKIFECKCGRTEVFIEQQGNNCGLYCADCGKWLTWLNKDSKRLAERQINGVEQKIRSKAIDDFARYMSEYIDNHGAGDLIDRPYTRMLEIAEQLKAGDTDASNGA